MNSTTATARSVLGVPESASVEEASCEFLRGLVGDDYVPSSVKVQALNVIGCLRLPWERDAVSELECVDEVAVFAREYWSLEPAVRRSRWESLRDRRLCEYRLRELERGLDVVVIQLDDADANANELACVFRELFVLPRRERAIRRAQWLAENASEQERWMKAVTEFENESACSLKLDQELAEILQVEADWKLFAKTIATNPLQLCEKQKHDMQSTRSGFTNVVESYDLAGDSTPKRIVFIGWFAIMFTLALSQILPIVDPSQERRQDQKPTFNSNQKIMIPGQSKNPFETNKPTRVPVETFTTAEWIEFGMYEDALRNNQYRQVPRRYGDWVLAGKPQPRMENPRP